MIECAEFHIVCGKAPFGRLRGRWGLAVPPKGAVKPSAQGPPDTNAPLDARPVSGHGVTFLRGKDDTRPLSRSKGALRVRKTTSMRNST